MKISAISIMNGFNPHAIKAVNSVIDIADEVIIIDTGIDNKLIAKLNEYKQIKIIQYQKNIQFAELIREDVKKYAKNDYILFFDHDEIVTPGLKKLIGDTLGQYDYYLIPRKNIIFGKWIQHAKWWPDYQVRLLKKNAVHWARDIDIHKQPELAGKGLTIDEKEELAMLHYNYENIDDYLHKAMHYAKSEAKQLVDKKTDFGIATVINKSISEFVSRFYLTEGFKDLTHGLVLSFLQMIYFFFVYFYYWEMNSYKELDKNTIIETPRKFFLTGLINSNHWISEKNIDNKKNLLMKLENKLLKILK